MITPQYGYDYTGRPYCPPMQQIPYQAQQPMQPMPQAPMMQAVPQQIRSGGIVSVANEEVARNYPVAPGVTVTMRDESAPYLYEKTMGFSQLDQPIFRKARIVFEDTPQNMQDAPAEPETPRAVYAELAQLEALRDAVVADIKDLHKQVDKETAEIRSLISAMIKPEPEKKTGRKKEADDE